MRTFRKFLRVYNGFILPVILIMVSAGITFWGIIPGVKAIQTMFIRNDELSKEVEIVRQRVGILKSFDMNSLESYLTALLSAVPTDKSLPTVLIGLESVAQQTQTALNNFEIIEPGSISSESAELSGTRTGGQYTVNSKISYAGTMEQLQSFVDTIVRVRRLMAITEFTINFQSEDNILLASSNVRAFYMPLPKTLGKATDKLEQFSDKDLELLTLISNYPLAQLAGSVPTGPSETFREDPFRL